MMLTASLTTDWYRKQSTSAKSDYSSKELLEDGEEAGLEGEANGSRARGRSDRGVEGCLGQRALAKY